MATSSTSSASGTGSLNSYEQVVYLNSCLEKLNADSECGIALNADPKCGILQDSFRVIKKVSAPTENIDEVMIKLAAPILAISFLKEIPLLDVPLLRNLKDNLTSFYIKSKLVNSPLANRIYALLLEDVQMKLAYRFCVADNEFPETLEKCEIIEELSKTYNMNCNLWGDKELLLAQETLSVIAFQRQFFESAHLYNERSKQIDIMRKTMEPYRKGEMFNVPPEWDFDCYMLIRRYADTPLSYDSTFDLLKHAVELNERPSKIKYKGIEVVINFLQIQLCQLEQHLNYYYHEELLEPCLENFMKRHSKYDDLYSPLFTYIRANSDVQETPLGEMRVTKMLCAQNKAFEKYEANYPALSNDYRRGIDKLKEYGALKNIPISQLLISPWRDSMPFVSLCQELEPIFTRTASSPTLFYCSQEMEKFRRHLIQQKLFSSSSSPSRSFSRSSSSPPFSRSSLRSSSRSSSSPPSSRSSRSSPPPSSPSLSSSSPPPSPSPSLSSSPPPSSRSLSSSPPLSSSSSSTKKLRTKIESKKPEKASSNLKTKDGITSKPSLNSTPSSPPPSLSSSPPPSSSSSSSLEKLGAKSKNKKLKVAPSDFKTKNTSEELSTKVESKEPKIDPFDLKAKNTSKKLATKVESKEPKKASTNSKTSSITSKPKPSFDSTPLPLPFTYAKRVKDWFMPDRNDPKFPLNDRDEYAAVRHNKKISDKIIAAHTFPKAIDFVAAHIGIRGTHDSDTIANVTYETITLLAQIEDANKNLSRRELITYGINPKNNKDLIHRSLSLARQSEEVEADISQCMKDLAWPSLKNIKAMEAKIAKAKPRLLDKLRASDGSRLIEIDLNELVFHRPKDKLTIRVMNPQGIDGLEALLAMLDPS